MDPKGCALSSHLTSHVLTADHCLQMEPTPASSRSTPAHGTFLQGESHHTGASYRL